MNNSLFTYIARRLLQLVPIVLLIILVTYVLLRLAPGDLADVIAGESGSATPEYMEQLRRQFNLDLPASTVFFNYLKNLLHFDLGFSFRHGMPVADLIVDRVGPTLVLMLTSIMLATVIGVTLGVLSARYRGSLLDEAISLVSTLGFATPVFWVGLVLIVIFSVNLRWLPSAGMTSIGGPPLASWAGMAELVRHLVLPASTLAFFYLSIYVRVTRSAMLEVYGLDFVRTARAKGLSESRIAVKHVLRNALLPVVTLTGLQLASLLGGSIVIETIFAWPGLGRLAYDAVFNRDINLLMGVFLFSSLLVVFMNLLVDILYALLDPRIAGKRS
ncbi:ABC transporter permease [Advenella kashmirensis W13003]|uniref:ABC transporter permease n=1 Tax=Advenella kashmirensis W13003 TaxID=1424334 RepID=V8QQ14_9BURK|nr:ABC transporter permease [Advenella kashmirensis]ETF01074.1 ABC transporter permease [Advenella kashmirensis W13003]